MLFTRWLSTHRGAPLRRKALAPPSRFRPRLEALEDRWQPSTLTVQNNHDSGAGSLRAAIAAAHNGDTIAFAPSMAGQTITLTSGELFIKRNLTIAGPSDRSVTVSGGNASRVFELSASPRPQVSLSGLTISNGYAPGPFGHSLDNGGGILNEGTLFVVNCTVSHNSAAMGAGILNDAGAVLQVNDSTVSNNNADRDYQSIGGGIDNYGTLIVHGSTLSYNSASGAGGAICTAIGSVTINSSAVPSVLSHNTAGGGGAIAGSVGTSGAVTLSDCTLSDNSARLNGGGISFGPGTLALNRCTLSGNSAANQGGAISVGDGGNTTGSAVTVSGCTITGNSAVLGGGIYAGNSGWGPVTVTVTASTLSGNVASTSGGGIYMTSNATGNVNVSMTVSGCTLSGNTATSGSGGGIFNASSGTLTVSNSAFGTPLADTPDNIFGVWVDGGGNTFA